MREKKIRYTFEHVATGNIEQKIYTLSQLEERNVKELSPCFNPEFGYRLIGRDDFTGLKDKNGKEIFEGDIVKGWKDSHWHDGKDRVLKEVEWIDEMGGFNIIQIEMRECEVIGNIYENPDLLEGIA